MNQSVHTRIRPVTQREASVFAELGFAPKEEQRYLCRQRALSEQSAPLRIAAFAQSFARIADKSLMEFYNRS